MFDPNPARTHSLGKFPLLTGVFLDPTTGPLTLSRPVAVLRDANTDKITEIDESVTEDIPKVNWMHITLYSDGHH
ncbi:unnamed protein product [Rhizoctonia solani]|uniref:Uncharacterized protein n=1 Tax=Rhizoctonia solani TaxID=456999 RepID=A0A8H3CRH8_9AGAM|nr:unnamed protein product [Rhizoctonia solani]